MLQGDEEPQEPMLVLSGPDGRTQKFFIGIVSFIGRSTECDICLQGPGIAATHAVLARTPSGLVLRDLFTPVGVQVNGEQVRETLLSDGDEIRFGDLRLTVSAPEDGGPLGDVQIQQDLIQQMADRLSKQEHRRRKLVQQAWDFRLRSRSKLPPAGGGALRLELEQARAEAAKSRSELDNLRLKPRSVGLPAAPENAALRRELESARQQLAAVGAGASNHAELEALRTENSRLEAELASLASAASDLQAAGGLKEFERQLDEYREQLGRDAETFQRRESDFADREREQAETIEQLQAKMKQFETESAAERARLNREQANLDRAVSDARNSLEELMRQAETIERDERLSKLRTHVRTDGTTSPEQTTRLSDRINRFLKGLGK